MVVCVPSSDMTGTSTSEPALPPKSLLVLTHTTTKYHITMFVFQICDSSVPQIDVP